LQLPYKLIQQSNTLLSVGLLPDCLYGSCTNTDTQD